jgi:phenylacetate-coenzyme A ligase PaaK-like adenylate-forming protein
VTVAKANAPGDNARTMRSVRRPLLPLLLDARGARRGPPGRITPRQRERLAELVAWARTRSPCFRDLYRALPFRVVDVQALPVTRKQELMARFDEWVADPAVTLDRVRAFTADPALAGRRFLGRYFVATTSGTTGTPGTFLMDEGALAVGNAIVFRMLRDWLSPREVARVVGGRARLAMVNATGGHYASLVAAARLREASPLLRRAVRVFSVHEPPAALVASLNEFQPALLAVYASTASILAREAEAGRLRIRPVLVVLSAEGPGPGESERLARALGAKVRQTYAATECPFLGYSCAEEWIHLNSDWAIVEPVDSEYRPVPPGEQSHTVLITNLANRVQPILRYDIGDSLVARPEPCRCGNPLPAVRLRGRTVEMLTFPGRDGGAEVAVPPLAFAAVVYGVPGMDLFQVVQVAPTTLRLRFRTGVDPDRVWEGARDALRAVLAAHGLDHVTVERASEPPQQSPGGKYLQVIALGHREPGAADARQ